MQSIGRQFAICLSFLFVLRVEFEPKEGRTDSVNSSSSRQFTFGLVRSLENCTHRFRAV